MEYADFIRKCEKGKVYSIDEPIFFPRFIKTILFQLQDPIMCVSPSISINTLIKSFCKICSEEELAQLKKKDLYYDSTVDMDFNNMVKRVFPVIIENNIRWLIIKTSGDFFNMNEKSLTLLAKDYKMTIIVIGVK